MTTLTFSQGIVSHSTTTGLPGGAQNFLVINSDKVNLHAPVDQPLVTVFAHRDTHYILTLQAGVDIQAWGYGNITSNNAPMDNINGGGPGTNEYYLYIDINRATGSTTYGYSIYDPSSGSTPPSTNVNRKTDQHWFDTNARIMKVWRATGIPPNYGTWTEVIRIFVGKYIFGASFSSVSVNIPSFIGTTVGLVGTFRAGSLIYDVIGNPVLRTDSNNVSVFFTTEDVFTSGLPATSSPVSGNRARYETFLVDAIGLTPAPAYTAIKFDSFAKVLPLDALSQPNSLWGLIEFPIGSSGDLVQVTMSGVVRNPLWNWSLVGQQIFVDKNNDGILVTVEDNGYVPGPAQLPVGVAIDRTALLIRRPELALTTGGTGSGVTDHTLLTNIGVNTHDQIDTHISNSTIHQPQLNIGSPQGSILNHDVLINVGTNSHSDIDTHISNTNIHTALTVEDVLGSPITSVGNVNTIQFNNSSGFDVVDQTGGVVRIDFNSAFNPFSLSASGGTAAGDTTMTASGEEEFRFIAGSNVTLTGDNASSPKSITISAAGGGGGSPIVIPSRIQDSDNDTFVDSEYGGGDSDLIRIQSAGGYTGFLYGARIDVKKQTYGGFSYGGDIDIKGGRGNKYGGDILIESGRSLNSTNGAGGEIRLSTGSAPNGGTYSKGGYLTLETGPANDGYGGNIQISTGDGGRQGGHIELVTGRGNISAAHQFGSSIYMEGGQDAGIGTGFQKRGGNLNIKGGATYSDAVSVGGAVRIYGGYHGYSGGGTAGPVKIYGGNSIGATGSYGGYVSITGGTAPYLGGDITIRGGSGSNGTGGTVKIYGGESEATEFPGSDVKIYGGPSDTGAGGDVVLQGAIGKGTHPGGTIYLTTGHSLGSGGIGNVIMRASGGTTAPLLAFTEANANGSTTISLKAPNALSVSRVWTLPAQDPAAVAGDFLTTDASGNLSFSPAPGGSPSPSGGGLPKFAQIRATSGISFSNIDASESDIEFSTIDAFSTYTNVIVVPGSESSESSVSIGEATIAEVQCVITFTNLITSGSVRVLLKIDGNVYASAYMVPTTYVAGSPGGTPSNDPHVFLRSPVLSFTGSELIQVFVSNDSNGSAILAVFGTQPKVYMTITEKA